MCNAGLCVFVCEQVPACVEQCVSADIRSRCVRLGVWAHACDSVTVCVCELSPHCAGLQRPKRLLLPLGGSGLKIMWCAVSGGEQGADS